MKRLFVLMILVFIICGCATSPMNFKIPYGLTHNDYTAAVQECESRVGKQTGGFIFGPLIIVAPVVAAVSAVNHYKRNSFQTCMEEKGYLCTSNCSHESTTKVAAVKQSPSISNRNVQVADDQTQNDDKHDIPVFENATCEERCRMMSDRGELASGMTLPDCILSVCR